MVEFEQIDKLTRAWILVRAVDDEVSVAEQIYMLNAKLQWPSFRVVRADVVDAIDGLEGVNIVVPVWAPNWEGVQEIREMIGGLDVVRDTQMLVVKRGPDKPLQFPFPPHKAHGYVSVEESNPGAVPLGFNGWG